MRETLGFCRNWDAYQNAVEDIKETKAFDHIVIRGPPLGSDHIVRTHRPTDDCFLLHELRIDAMTYRTRLFLNMGELDDECSGFESGSLFEHHGLIPELMMDDENNPEGRCVWDDDWWDDRGYFDVSNP